MANTWNVSDRILVGLSEARRLQMVAPPAQPFAPPGPSPYQPDAFRPNPYAPQPQPPYQPQPQPWAPQPQPQPPYQPQPQPYAPPQPQPPYYPQPPAPQNYPPMPQPYAPPPYQPPQPPAPYPQPPAPYAPQPQPYAPPPQPFQPVAPRGNQAPIALGPQNFDREVLQTPGVVLVDFYATYCGPCKDLAPLLHDMALRSSDMRVGKVTCDQDGAALKDRFNVRAFPTMVVFKDGKEIGRVEGALDANQLEEWKRRGFPRLGA